jgi:hypothetical protein
MRKKLCGSKGTKFPSQRWGKGENISGIPRRRRCKIHKRIAINSAKR